MYEAGWVGWMVATVTLVSSITSRQTRGSSSAAVSSTHGSGRWANVRKSGTSFVPLRSNWANETAFRPRFRSSVPIRGRRLSSTMTSNTSLRGSEIRVDGLEPAYGVIDLSRFEVEFLSEQVHTVSGSGRLSDETGWYSTTLDSRTTG